VLGSAPADRIRKALRLQFTWIDIKVIGGEGILLTGSGKLRRIVRGEEYVGLGVLI
jgi:hypothetical protein